MAKKKQTARSRQRHRALDVVFEADEKGMIDEDALLSLLAERQSVSTSQVPIGEFGSQVVEAYATNADNVDSIIEAASEDWALARMNFFVAAPLSSCSSEHLALSLFPNIRHWRESSPLTGRLALSWACSTVSPTFAKARRARIPRRAATHRHRGLRFRRKPLF